MILEYMHINPILEMGMPGDRDGLDPNQPFPEAEPLKKYELIQKLDRVRNILRSKNIYDQDLDTIMTFSSELSYETLLALSNSIIERLSEYIAGIKNNEEK